MKTNILATGFRLQASGYRLQATAHSKALLVCLLLLLTPCFAEEVDILYTGQSHAMLYPCNCPIERDGGLARRATLVQQLKEKNPQTLLLDAGAFFAGGEVDEYSQTAELDKERTRVNLKVLQELKYDGLGIGVNEFNFGREFLEENIAWLGIPFLSCNIKSEKMSQYLIKEVDGLKVGITAVTSLAAIEKAGGLRFLEPKVALQQTIGKMKEEGVAVVVVLSNLSDEEDVALLKEISGITVLIAGHSRSSGTVFEKRNSTLVVWPAWQARRLGRISLRLKAGRVTSSQVEELRLSDKLSDDPKITSLLPQCFSDSNCKKKGFVGSCVEPGSLKAQCLYKAANQVNLTVVTSKDCHLCDTQRMVDYLSGQIPNLAVSYLYYPADNALRLLEDSRAGVLPLFILDKQIEKENFFVSFKANLQKKKDFYLVDPQVSGISYFPGRAKSPGRLDMFFSLYSKDIAKIWEVSKEFRPTVHFLVSESQGKFDSAGGKIEVEDSLRAVCVQEHYPEKFFSYLSCRMQNIDSSWWDDCLAPAEAEKIKLCAKGREGLGLLGKNIALTKELQVMFGPAYLLDNQQIFASRGIPSRADLEKVIRQKDKK